MIDSGIYIIYNLTNSKTYVGKTKNFTERWRNHRKQLNKNNHSNIHLQRAWNKHGKESFIFVAIEKIPPDELLLMGQKEAYWAETLQAIQKGYNLAIVLPEGSYTHSTESKTKMRISHLGVKLPPERIANSAAAHKGLKRTLETRAKMSRANIGQKTTEEQRIKISVAKTGKTLTPEHKAKLAIARKERTTLTASDRRQILSRYRAGEHRANLAKEYNIGPNSVSVISRGVIYDNRVGRILKLIDGVWVTVKSNKLTKQQINQTTRV